MTKTVSGRSNRPLKEKVSITIDEDVVVEIKKLAEEDQRSFSQCVNRVLRKHIRESEKRI